MGDWNFENVPGCIPDELEPFFEPETYQVNMCSSCDMMFMQNETTVEDIA